MKASEAFLKNEDAQAPPQIDWKRISRRGSLFLKAFSPEDSLVLQLTSLAQAFILPFENHCSESSPQMASTKIPYSLSVGQGEYSLTCATWCYLLLKICCKPNLKKRCLGEIQYILNLEVPQVFFRSHPLCLHSHLPPLDMALVGPLWALRICVWGQLEVSFKVSLIPSINFWKYLFVQMNARFSVVIWVYVIQPLVETNKLTENLHVFLGLQTSWTPWPFTLLLPSCRSISIVIGSSRIKAKELASSPDCATMYMCDLGCLI